MNLQGADIELIIRLGLAAVCGGMIGFERELHGKEAGFRTYSLVSIGSALAMIISIHAFEVYKGIAEVDPSRIAAQVISGVGFLGAGTIIRSGKDIKGLTTAAGLWTAASIGLACGIGYYKAAFVGTITTLMVLVVFSWIGRQLGGRDV